MDRPELPSEIEIAIALLAEQLGMTTEDFWAVCLRQKPRPPHWAEFWATLGRRLTSRGVLTNRSQKSRVNGNDMMNDTHRIAIAKGQKRKDKWTTTIHARGYTQNKLAGAAGVTPAFLSMCRSGERPAPKVLRERVETLTGWPADSWKRLGD